MRFTIENHILVETNLVPATVIKELLPGYRLEKQDHLNSLFIRSDLV